MVYKMLRAEGYPTDPVKRKKRLEELNTARWPSELPQNMTNSPGQLPQGPSATPNSYTTFSNSQPSIHLPVRYSICVPEFHLEDTKVEFQSANLSQHGQTRGYPLDASEDGHVVQTEQTPAAVPSESSLYHTPLTSADFQEGQNPFAGLFDGGALYPDFRLHYPLESLKTPTITRSQIFRNEPESEPLSQSHMMVRDVTESFDAPGPMSSSGDDSFSTVVDTSSTFTQAPRPATTGVSRKTSSTSLAFHSSSYPPGGLGFAAYFSTSFDMTNEMQPEHQQQPPSLMEAQTINQPSRRRRITAQEWESQRDLIHHLYITERSPLSSVMDTMSKEHGFNAT